jgi:hypothetical protein
MEKAYNIKDIRFENNDIIVKVDELVIKLKLVDISDKLAKATDKERLDYKISPSGYGIHWKQLDEDLSINGLLKVDKTKHALGKTAPK